MQYKYQSATSSLPQPQQSQQLWLLGLSHLLESFSMVRVYPRPSLLSRDLLHTLMDEVASISETTKPFFGEGVTALGFVGTIVLHIDPKILRAMRKLTLLSVGAAASIHEVLAE